MDIVRILPVTPAMVATDAVDADPAWSGPTTYADQARATHQRRIWLSLQSGNTGHEPGQPGSEAWWSDAGPSNRWAMFDDEVGTVSTRAGSLSVTINGIGAPMVALLNVRGKTARCVSVHGAATVYDRTVQLWDTSVIADWADYFFAEPEFRGEALFEGLPGVPGQSVTVTVTAAGSSAQIGMCLPGRPFFAGDERFGVQRSGNDYSTVTFDPYGKATIRRRGYAREISTQTRLHNREFDRLARRLDQIASEPVLVLSGRPVAEATIVYGLVSYSLDLATPRYSYASIDAKGLI